MFLSRAPCARTLTAAFATAAVCSALTCAVTASSALACSGGYTYAGLYTDRPVAGVAASMSMLSAPTVNGGSGSHVAAWVGVGGPGMGPGGTNEWLQVGLASFDRPDGRLYFELALPHKAPKFTELASGIQPGDSLRVAVMELPFDANHWIVITPKGIEGPFYLPGSHGKWSPVATGESWAKGGSLCNTYAYRFDGVELASKRGWRRLHDGLKLQDRGSRVHRISPDTFSATTV